MNVARPCSNVTRERRDNTSTMSEELLELAIDYIVSSQYPPGLDKAKKRAIRRREATLTIEKGEVFVERRGRKVKVIITVQSTKNGFVNHVDL